MLTGIGGIISVATGTAALVNGRIPKLSPVLYVDLIDALLSISLQVAGRVLGRAGGAREHDCNEQADRWR
jgi:hypothetical protein